MLLGSRRRGNRRGSAQRREGSASGLTGGLLLAVLRRHVRPASKTDEALRDANNPQPPLRPGSYGRIEPMIFSTETLLVTKRCLTASAYHVRYQRVVASATSGPASAS